MALTAVAFGALAVPQLKQQLLPSIDLPMVSVIAPYQGAAPDVVEKQVVEPLEDGIQVVAVTTDAKQPARAGLSPADLSKALKAGGASVPAGSFAEDGKSKTGQVGSGYTSLTQIENLRVPGKGDPVAVGRELRPGSSLGAADKQAKKVEKLLSGIDGVEDYQVTIGSAGLMAAFGGGTDANQASYQIKLAESADSDRVQREVSEGLDALGPSLGETKVGSGDGFGGQDLSVVVKAGDADVLKRATDDVRAKIAQLDGVTDVQSDLSRSVPRISVSAKDSAAGYGLNDAAFGQAVMEAVSGAKSGKATLDDTEREVVVRSPEPAETVAELKKLPLGKTTLGQVADIRTVEGPAQMTRIDGTRAATITAKPTGDNTGEVSTKLQPEINSLNPPRGATAEIGGVSEDQDEAFSSLGLAMLAAVAIVLLLLVGTFRSLIQPLILLVSTPFAATGTIGLPVATGTPMGVPAMSGMLMLIGIVVTSTIVLIDLINQYRGQGYAVIDAVIEGGRHRLRPILMTALATIGALTPMALAVMGDAGFFSQPLAVVVIGGLITSTLLTLLLVPTLYAMVELRKERRASKKAAERGAAPADEAVAH